MKYALSIFYFVAASLSAMAGGLTVSSHNGTAGNLSINNTNAGHLWFGTNAGGAYMALIGNPPVQLMSWNGTDAGTFLFLGSDEALPRGCVVGSVSTGVGPVVFFDGYDGTGGGETDFPLAFQHSSFAPVLIGTSSQFLGGPMLQVHGDIATDGAYINLVQPIKVTIDGQGATLVAGTKYPYFVEKNLTLKQVTMLADQSGSAVVDIWKCTYAQYDAGATHPVVADSITAAAPPTITTATKSQDATLTGWNTTLSAGDVLMFNVTSATSITKLTLSIKAVTR